MSNPTMILHTLTINDGGGIEDYAAVTVPWAALDNILDGERWNGYQEQRETLHASIPALWRSALGYSLEYRDEIYVECDGGGLRVVGLLVEDMRPEHRTLVAYGGIGHCPR